LKLALIPKGVVSGNKYNTDIFFFQLSCANMCNRMDRPLFRCSDWMKVNAVGFS